MYHSKHINAFQANKGRISFKFCFDCPCLAKSSFTRVTFSLQTILKKNRCTLRTATCIDCGWWESNPHPLGLVPKTSVSAIPPHPQIKNRGDATRTRNRRFWRPLLYQLNYSPIGLRHFTTYLKPCQDLICSKITHIELLYTTVL